MTPTFGELAATAEIHLGCVRRYPTFTLPRRELLVAAGAVRTCVGAVVRLADMTKRDGRPILDPNAGWQQALQNLDSELGLAAVAAEALAQRSTDRGGSPPMRRLADAATAIGAAVDLLATHFEVGPHGIGYRGEFGPYVDGIDGRRGIAVRVEEFAAMLAPIARDIALAVHAHRDQRSAAFANALLDVSEHLRRAGMDKNEFAGAEALSAIPAVERIRHDPTAPTREDAALLGRAIGCGERLHRLTVLDTVSPTADPAALAVVASTIAGTQAMAARCLRHLADQAEHLAPDLNVARAGRGMRASADATERAYQRWVDVRDGLRGGRALISRGMGLPMRAEAGDLLLAVGRLVHTDPDWQPRVGGNDNLRHPEELAPNLRSLGELCAGLHRLAAVNALTAHRQAGLVRAMACNDQFLLPTGWLPESDDVRGRYTPMPSDETTALVRRYVAARDATAGAARRIDALRHMLGPLRSDLATQAELTRWRIPTAWRAEHQAVSGERDPLAVAL
jgi:hypothetical protein